MFDVTSYTVRRWINEGKFEKYMTVNGHRRVPRWAVIKFAEERYK